ncbi:MAG: hypothetical protein ACLR0U_16295 [Enterocloster clostridioformis]
MPPANLRSTRNQERSGEYQRGWRGRRKRGIQQRKRTLSYTVNYYKDSIEEGNYLDKVEGTAGRFGDAIPADLTKFAPAGCASTRNQERAGEDRADGGDVVNVVYSKKTNLSYTGGLLQGQHRRRKLP